MQLSSHNKLFSLLFFFIVFAAFNSKAQSLLLNPPSQCFSAGSTSAVVSVTSIPGATSYSWSANTSTGCVNFVPIASNGSISAVHFLCCGNPILTCTAYNGSTVVTTVSINASIYCPPVVSVAGNASICAGSAATLFASGAITYTWNSMFTGSQIVASPTASSVYSVIGQDFNGCVDTASVMVSVTPPPIPNFNTSVFSNGFVVFNNTTTNTLSGVSYTWNFGNGSISTSPSPSTTYSANGTYTTTLTASNGAGCMPVTTVHTVQVTSVIGCSANFNYTVNPNGYVTFINSSTGTFSNTNFYWNFGNGTTYSATGSPGTYVTNTYTANGVYTVNLLIFSPSTSCGASISHTILVSGIVGCSLTADFVYTYTSSPYALNFLSTSSGTTSTASYTWNYGDSGTGFGPVSTHTYSTSGTYIVSLTVKDSVFGSCVSTKTMAVILNTVCALSANFTHTVMNNGLVHFSSSSSTISSNVKYYWDFGDGVMSLAPDPVHVYSNSGTYFVTLTLSDSIYTYCKDSLVVSLNITGVTCAANSHFTLIPTGTPNYWTATPSYPWNVTAASWSWGDGTISNNLYTSHVYSVASTYSICLTVTVSCGASSTYCYPYLINKGNDNSSVFYNINVVPPDISTTLAELNAEKEFYYVYPNPNNGEFSIAFQSGDIKDISILVYDLVGKILYTSEGHSSDMQTIRLDDVANGIYFIRIHSSGISYTKKILVTGK